MTQVADLLAHVNLYSIATVIAFIGFANALYASKVAESERDNYKYVSAILALLWYISSLLLILTVK